MEFVELKSAWDVLQQDVIENDKVEVDQIEKSIHGKSKSELSKIRRSLHFKFIMASLSILVAIVLAISSYLNPSLNPFQFIFSPVESVLLYLVMAVSVSVMVYFNYKAYVQIKAVQNSSLNLKENLKHFIEAMKRAVSFNIYSDTFMTPIIFTWVFYAYAFEEQALGLNLRTALLILLPLLLSLFSNFFQRYMQRLKFGHYLQRLNEYLASLEK